MNNEIKNNHGISKNNTFRYNMYFEISPKYNETCYIIVYIVTVFFLRHFVNQE